MYWCMTANTHRSMILAWIAQRRRVPLGAPLVLLFVVVVAASLQSTVVASVSVGLLVGFLTGRLDRDARAETQCVEHQDQLPLISNRELMPVYESLRQSLVLLSGQGDEILKEATMLKLTTVQEELRTLASGKVVFLATESWRTVYERVLRSPGLGRYLSVAWLRDEDYWRDAPGRHSMQLNYELLELGLRIERTLILNDFYWPTAAALPAKVICAWIEEQHKRGVVMRLVRESELVEEPDLLCDFGIYGGRGCGLLELDDQCKTVRFTLDFDPQSVQQYEERWRRLLLFAVNFRELVDGKRSSG